MKAKKRAWLMGPVWAGGSPGSTHGAIASSMITLAQFNVETRKCAWLMEPA